MKKKCEFENQKGKMSTLEYSNQSRRSLKTMTDAFKLYYKAIHYINDPK